MRFRVALLAAWREQSRLVPKVTLIHVKATPPDKAGLTYPVKCYVELRNDSEVCIDVRMSDYKPNKMPPKLKLLNVLQLKFGNAWVPSIVEADRIAVLPRQIFRIWIPIDESKYTAEMVNRLLGEIGEVVLSVDDTRT
jgi:hypothetical protein